MKQKLLAGLAVGVMMVGMAVAAHATNITMNLSNWNDFPYDPYGNPSIRPTAKIEKTDDGIKIYGAGYRMGNVLVSNSTYDFSAGGSIDFKWRANGGGSYSGYGVGLLLSDPSRNTIGYEWYNFQNLATTGGLTTHHSYNGSTLISDNTWYYSTITINADHSSSGVTSINDYAKNGGVIIRNEISPPIISDYEWSFISVPEKPRPSGRGGKGTVFAVQN